MKLRVADDLLTLLVEAALDKEQVDKAMAAMGIAQNLNEGGERHRGKRRRIKVGASGCGTTNMPGAPCGELLTWNMSFNLKIKCNVFKGTAQGALLSGICAFAGHG